MLYKGHFYAEFGTNDRRDGMVCMSMDGKILWQIGRPDPRNGLLTNDTPFQIHDVDGDGKNESKPARMSS